MLTLKGLIIVRNKSGLVLTSKNYFVLNDVIPKFFVELTYACIISSKKSLNLYSAQLIRFHLHKGEN